MNGVSSFNLHLLLPFIYDIQLTITDNFMSYIYGLRYLFYGLLLIWLFSWLLPCASASQAMDDFAFAGFSDQLDDDNTMTPHDFADVSNNGTFSDGTQARIRRNDDNQGTKDGDNDYCMERNQVSFIVMCVMNGLLLLALVAAGIYFLVIWMQFNKLISGGDEGGRTLMMGKTTTLGGGTKMTTLGGSKLGKTTTLGGGSKLGKTTTLGRSKLGKTTKGGALTLKSGPKTKGGTIKGATISKAGAISKK